VGADRKTLLTCSVTRIQQGGPEQARPCKTDDDQPLRNQNRVRGRSPARATARAGAKLEIRAEPEEGRRSAAAGIRHQDRARRAAHRTRRTRRDVGHGQPAARASHSWKRQRKCGQHGREAAGPGSGAGLGVPTGYGRATTISSQSVKSVGQSARGGHHSTGRPDRINPVTSSWLTSFPTTISGRASLHLLNQTRFDGGELDLVIFGAHPPTAAEIAVIQHSRIT